MESNKGTLKSSFDHPWLLVAAVTSPNYFAIGGISALVGFGLTYLLQKQKEAKENQNGSPSKKANGQKGESPEKTKKRPLQKKKSENRFLEGKIHRISSCNVLSIELYTEAGIKTFFPK